MEGEALHIMTKRLYSSQEIAQLLNLSQKAVKEHIFMGDIDGIYLPEISEWGASKASLLEFIETSNKKVDVPASPIRVLIVEDDDVVRRVIQKTFDASDIECSITVATGGLEGFCKLMEIIPHLVMLDVSLPDLDGYEFIKRLRMASITPMPKVMAMSGDEGFLNEMMELGAEDALLKPFCITDLIEKAKRLTSHIEQKEF